MSDERGEDIIHKVQTAPAPTAADDERLDDAANQDMPTADGEENEAAAVAADGNEAANDTALQAMAANTDSAANQTAVSATGTEDPVDVTAALAVPETKPVAEAAPTPPRLPFDVGFIRDIPVHISVELGRSKMTIKDVMGLGQGSAIVLANLEGESLDIRANKRLIAKGEVLVENDKYGIRIKEIITSRERLDQLMP